MTIISTGAYVTMQMEKSSKSLYIYISPVADRSSIKGDCDAAVHFVVRMQNKLSLRTYFT